MPQTPPVVLTIAGFDPSSGAGITADIKTIAAHGCYGLAAITALTVQSTAAVRRVAVVEGQLFSETLDELGADVKLSAVHIGMLGTGDIAVRVADFLEREKPPNIVLDPVLKASSGTNLLEEGGVKVLTERLLQLATVVTPNVSEAASLTGATVANLEDMKQAAQVLHTMGAEAVVITGGELDHAIDVLSLKNDYTQVFRSDRVDSSNTHGTGCAFSTSVACQLALGRSLSTAVLLAKAYVTGAITNAYPIGKGIGPVNHMYQMKNHPKALAMTKKLASGRD
jgi:hydroxymethylpyrimidine/phosphomethylpyrimidine kinase